MTTALMAAEYFELAINVHSERFAFTSECQRWLTNDSHNGKQIRRKQCETSWFHATFNFLSCLYRRHQLKTFDNGSQYACLLQNHWIRMLRHMLQEHAYLVLHTILFSCAMCHHTMFTASIQREEQSSTVHLQWLARLRCILR